MAIIRMRDVIAVARTGVTFVGPGDLTWQFSLTDLYSRTSPTDWVPPLNQLADWTAGNYDLDRLAAERVTTQLNNAHPWAP